MAAGPRLTIRKIDIDYSPPKASAFIALAYSFML